jgi:hypothetical protein
MPTDRPDDKKPPVQEPPKPADEGADKTIQANAQPEMGPSDPAGSFSTDAVPSVNVVKPSANLKKKLNDLPNAADDPKRNDIPPNLKI